MKLEEAKVLCESLMEEHKLGKKWKFEWMKTYSTYGRCIKTKKTIFLSTNYVLANDESQVRNTILHEIAHAKCRVRGHNKYWRAWCVKIGARPLRLNTMAIAPERNK